jgi:hypothetical protein
MKTQIKDIVIGIFAVIGFTAVIMGFTNQTEPQQTYGTPESHVWEFHLETSGGNATAYGFAINKVTGEVRKYNTFYTGTEGKDANEHFNLYRITQPK